MTETTLRIDALAHGGDGVARGQGPVMFVPDTAPGDLVRVAVERGAGRLRRGRLLEILEPGAARREAPCPEAGACGGCQWQHVADEEQDAASRAILLEALRRIGRLSFDEARIAPTRGPAQRLATRQRMRLHAASRGGRTRTGFLRRGSHDVHEARLCHVLTPELEAVRARVAAAAPDLLRALGARVRGFELQVDMPGPDGAALLEVEAPARREDLAAALDVLSVAVASLVALEAASHGGRGAVRTSRGAPRIGYRSGPLEAPEAHGLHLSPGGFLQATRAGNALLVSRVIDAVASLGLPEGARVLELFAGNGNLSLALGALGLRVRASDSDARAVENARLAARGAEGLSFEVIDAAAHVGTVASQGASFDVVVMDPPRIGAREASEALAAAGVLGARSIVLVSCDAATLARDMSTLACAGFGLERAEALTIFPQSAHFEAVAVMVRE